MKNIFRISGFILLILSVESCKKDIHTPPVITTNDVTEISYTTATSGGEVTDEGRVPVKYNGVCWNTSANPTISNSRTMQSGASGSFTSNITLLAPNTLYYVRAFAINSAGMGYGNEVSFTTSRVKVPVLTTAVITSITQNSAVSGGNITVNNGGYVIASGVCWDTIQNPTILGNKTLSVAGIGIFTASLNGLKRATKYYVRAYATNSEGTAYGNEQSFATTSVGVPVLSTNAILFVATTRTTVGSNISDDGGADVIARGVCWSASRNPTITDNKTADSLGTGSFISMMSGLKANTTYYVRAWAANSFGVGYGNQINLTTNATVTDLDGNVYNTVTIGAQTWLADNLKTTKYNDNTSISVVDDYNAWTKLSTPGFTAIYSPSYGALYNWYAVNTGKLCLTGWHVPTDAEWTVLTTYLGGESIAGLKLKESGTTHWASPNTGATNESGFSALPGGYRNYDGFFANVGGESRWWCSGSTWTRSMGNFGGMVFKSDLYDKRNGFSVRCLKDN